jgi:hypothetical protein
MYYRLVDTTRAYVLELGLSDAKAEPESQRNGHDISNGERPCLDVV